MSLGKDLLDDYAYELSHNVSGNKKQSSIFSRGYNESRERMAKNPRYSMSCFNCAYYYQASGDKEEVCQNSNVLEYDMVVEGNNIYCLKWAQNKSSTTNKIFKKRGRELLS